MSSGMEGAPEYMHQVFDFAGGIGGFDTEQAALDYLYEKVPDPADLPETIDVTPFKDQLFEVPEELTEGSYAFEGAGAFYVSFDLVGRDGFDDYWEAFRNDSMVQGDHQSCFYMRDLTIRTPNFLFTQKYPESEKLNHSRYASVLWFPDLNSGESELSHDYVNLGSKKVWLLDQDGFMARPLDLLGIFHELGHLETNPYLPRGISRPAADAARMLQKELAANAWMLQENRPLFEDLGIDMDLVEDYARHTQPRSYFDSIRHSGVLELEASGETVN